MIGVGQFLPNIPTNALGRQGSGKGNYCGNWKPRQGPRLGVTKCREVRAGGRRGRRRGGGDYRIINFL